MENKSKEELLELLRKKDDEILRLKEQLNSGISHQITPVTLHGLNDFKLTSEVLSLDNNAIARYSRQLILPEVGPAGQTKLLGAGVLVVGCGGLGCPAAIYLAAAGVGRVGLVDYDVVETSNLHRQVVHTEHRVGMAKAASIAHALLALNKNTKVVPYDIILTSQVALQLVADYDIILDCTDNVATRYLLNDACVMAHKPLVSGSALRFEGQLTVYHYKGGPCYRCLHPRPPPPETVTNCSDGGVLGVVPGTIGVLQALEAVKIIVGIGNPLSQSLLLFDALAATFRKVKLREHKKDCDVCGDNPTIKELIDYEQFCGAAATDKDSGVKLLPRGQRLTVEEYRDVQAASQPHLLLDVRLPVELEICRMPDSLNVPLKQLHTPASLASIKEALVQRGSNRIYCICRRGNDSQKAVKKLLELLEGEDYIVKDVIGGTTAWAQKIDLTFPIY